MKYRAAVFRIWSLHLKINSQGNAKAKAQIWVEGDSWRPETVWMNRAWRMPLCYILGKSVRPGVLGWQLTVRISLPSVQNYVWWPWTLLPGQCKLFSDPAHKAIPHLQLKLSFGHFLTVKTSLKSPVALCQGNSADGSNANPAGYPSMKRPGESECLHGDSSFPVGRDALMHLKTHTWKERAEQPFSPHYYLIF